MTVRNTTRHQPPSPLRVPKDMWKGPGCIPGSTMGMAGFPLHRFWRRGRYYENEFAFQMGTTTGESVWFPVGSYWVCEQAEERPFTSDPTSPDVDITGIYVKLIGLHPTTKQPVRVEFFPHTQTGRNEQFSVVENEMLIIALATEGLVL